MAWARGERRVWFQARVGAAKGRIRRIAIVALARKLLVASRACPRVQRNATVECVLFE